MSTTERDRPRPRAELAVCEIVGSLSLGFGFLVAAGGTLGLLAADSATPPLLTILVGLQLATFGTLFRRP